MRATQGSVLVFLCVDKLLSFNSRFHLERAKGGAFTVHMVFEPMELVHMQNPHEFSAVMFLKSRGAQRQKGCGGGEGRVWGLPLRIDCFVMLHKFLMSWQVVTYARLYHSPRAEHRSPSVSCHVCKLSHL